MGGKTSRKSNPAKARCNTSKQNSQKHIGIKQSAKKKYQKLSKDQSERVRDALNRDVDLLYNFALENPPTAPSSFPWTGSLVSLAESMQGLGRQ